MFELREEIAKRFASTAGDGGYGLSDLTDGYGTWVMKTGPMFGVAIEYNGPEFFETFASAAIKKITIKDNGKDTDVLLLYTSNVEMRDTFAAICADFADPGENGAKRNHITQHPLSWWQEWKDLLGNAEGSLMIYDVLGELLALEKLLKDGKNPSWAAVSGGTHDIETAECPYEVKSTTQKATSQIHISSQFQLDSKRPLYLIFNRFEKSILGRSIDEVMDEISKIDPKGSALYEKYLEGKGFATGNHYRKQQYRLLERRKYLIDESFPKIVEESFKGDAFPVGITHIEYDVDLDGLPFENWDA